MVMSPESQPAPLSEHLGRTNLAMISQRRVREIGGRRLDPG
jgi:hypothetical protein